ncbi:MAG: hypothetical protein GW760_04840 [Legionella sp.]|nr:hypothetical protein [Legionella sp.]
MFHLNVMLTCVLSVFLCSCTQLLVHTTPAVRLNVNRHIAVSVFKNKTPMPAANQLAQSVAVHELSTRGFQHIMVGSPSKYAQAKCKRKEDIQWAKNLGASYMVTGVVREWHDLVDLDAQFFVGITLQLTDTATGRLIWTADGSKKGCNREVLVTLITKELIHAMLVGLTA